VTPAPLKPEIDFTAFSVVDIRAGTIEHVDEVPGSDKLLRLTVNLGDHTRRFLSGIKKERAQPAELIDRQALFV
jgi:tRNA-binding protein